jgi:hypothetical protein
VYTEQACSGERITNGVRTLILFTLFIRKENRANVREGGDIL